jgi:hypothetical protein
MRRIAAFSALAATPLAVVAGLAPTSDAEAAPKADAGAVDAGDAGPTCSISLNGAIAATYACIARQRVMAVDDGGGYFVAVNIRSAPTAGPSEVTEATIVVMFPVPIGVVPPPVGVETKVTEPGGATWESPLMSPASSLRVTSIGTDTIHGVVDTTSPCTNIARGYTPPDLRVRIVF